MTDSTVKNKSQHFGVRQKQCHVRYFERNGYYEVFRKLENRHSKGETVAACLTAAAVVVGLLVSGQILREYRMYDVGCVSRVINQTMLCNM